MTDLLDSNDLRDRGIRFSHATLWRLVRKGKFPRPLKVSPQRRVWVASEIEAWLEARKNERAA